MTAEMVRPVRIEILDANPFAETPETADAGSRARSVQGSFARQCDATLLPAHGSILALPMNVRAKRTCGAEMKATRMPRTECGGFLVPRNRPYKGSAWLI